jgi:hypothetical protein
LRNAIREGHVDVAAYLFSKGASIKDLQRDKPRFGILDDVVRRGNFAMLQFIVNRGANIYANGESALRIAVFEEHRYVLDYLLAESIRNKRPFRTVPNLIQQCKISGSPQDIVERLETYCHNTHVQAHGHAHAQIQTHLSCTIS